MIRELFIHQKAPSQDTKNLEEMSSNETGGEKVSKK